MADHSPNDRRQDRPQLSWVMVRDAGGRCRMEALWGLAPTATPAPSAVPAHSAA